MIFEFRFFVALIPVFLVGCSWGSRQLSSNWDALKSAESIKCHEIPIPDSDLRIDKIHIVRSGAQPMLLEVTSRKGLKLLYSISYNSVSDIKVERFLALPMAQNSTFLGAGNIGKKFVVVLKTSERGRPVIQVREVATNAVIQQLKIENQGIWNIEDWNFSQNQLRILFREEKENEALDDQPYSLLELVNIGSDTARTNIVRTKKLIGQARIFNSSSGQANVISMDSGISEKAKLPKFSISSWSADSDAIDLPFKDDTPIESWIFQEGKEHLTLGFIKGDTLLWKNSSIEVLQLARKSPFVISRSLRLPLSKVHAAKPLLSQEPKDLYLLLPQWLDHEISIATYAIEATQLTPKGYLGAFKEGTSFHDAFYHEVSEETLVLMKGQANPIAKYSICRTGL